MIELPPSTVHEYKYVLLDSHSGQALTWQRGNNSVLAIKAGEDRIEVRPISSGLSPHVHQPPLMVQPRPLPSLAASQS